MATPAGVSQQYVDNSVVEDLTNVLTQLDPNETPFYSDIQTGPDAIDVYHMVLTDSLNTTADYTVSEGNTTTYSTRVEPQRVANYTQIFEVPFSVSDVQMAVKHAAIGDKRAYEQAKAMKELVIGMEKALITSSLNSGTASGTATRMNGLKASITSNLTTYSGTSLSEKILNDAITEAYTDGGNSDYVFTSMTLKKRISEFTGNVTDYRSADEMKAGRIVNVYEADASSAPVRITPSRYTTAGDLFVLQIDTWAKSNLIRPHFEERAKTGAREDGVVRGALTLEARAEKHNTLFTDLI